MTRDSRAAYRRWLWLAPAPLRRRHGAEMAEAFADAIDHARRHGAPAVAWVWLRSILDLFAARTRGWFPHRSPLSTSPSRGSVLMLGTDVRGSLRAFRRQRLSTLLVVVMLGLGIAASIVVFSLINALFLRPLPFDEPDRLVYLNEKAPTWNLDRTGINYPDFHQWRQATQTFEALALYGSGSFNLADDGGVERLTGARVTHDFMTVLRVQPLLGRMFTAEEDRPNGPRVAVISERMWRDRFGGDQGVLGRTLRVNGVVFEIIGVLPQHAEFPTEARLWVPLAGDPNQQGLSYSYDGIGRLKPQVTVAQAEEDLFRAQTPIWESRDRDRIVSPTIQPLHDTLVRDYRTIAQALFGAVTLLLVVACANVAAVMLARAIARRREMGIRLAIGASRSRLLRQLLVESALLAAAGGVLGVLLGRWALQALVLALPEGLPAWVSLAVDARTVVYALLVTAGAAVLFGWAPALHAVRGDLRATMADTASGSTSSPRGRRTLTWLVAAEFTLATVLIAGGGLLFRAFDQVRRTDPGYDPERVLTFSVSLPNAGYPDGAQRLAFWDRLLEQLRVTPGVQTAGAITCPPLTCHWGNFYRIEGRPPLKAGEINPVVLSRVATDGYFEAMGLRLREGRFFEARDGREGTEPVVIVNEMFARTFWPDAERVIGRRMAFNGENNPWMTVVGVTRDIKHYGLERPMRPGVYFPARMLAQRTSSLAVIVRTVGDPDAFAPTAHALVKAIDTSLPLYRVQNAQTMLDVSMRTRATYSWMLAVFAGLALVLALGGTYGVTSYLVTQRTREIGIRLAVGAGTRQIVRAILAGSLAAIVIGMTVGLAVIATSAGWLGDLLFGVSPRDPRILAGAAAILIMAAITANWIPARRAARTDPVQSLRV
jgi:predicted permease